VSLSSAEDQREFALALVKEAASKSGLLWYSVEGAVPTPVWNVWHDDAVVVLGEGVEQPLPGLVDGISIELVLRSKDKNTRVGRVAAVAHRLAPGSAEWESAAIVLRAKRLNSPDGERVIDRWRTDSSIWRLVPQPWLVEGPGNMDDHSHAAVPPPTPAVTVGRCRTTSTGGPCRDPAEP
jgi:hypothetical protein